jgi:protein-disulfide isomerase
MTKPLIQIGTEVREMTDEEFVEYELRQSAIMQEQEQAEAQAAAEEAAKQQAFNDAVAAAVAAALAAQQTPASTAEPIVEE